MKDRLGVALIENAERQGVLRPGMMLVEATGGKTGIGLAFAVGTGGTITGVATSLFARDGEG